MSGEAPESVGKPAGAPLPPASGSTASSHGIHIKLDFLEQLKRRNVGRIAILYVVACYVILETFGLFLHVLALPEWTGRAVAVLMLLGFPVALILAWVYEITPEGWKPTVEVEPSQSIRKQTGQRLNRAIIVTLSIALAYFVADKFWLAKRVAAERPKVQVAPVANPAAPAISDKSIAVLPFTDMSEKKDQEYFADGMAEETLDLLAKVPGIKVIGRTSSFQFKGRNEDLRTIGAKLGVAYVLEGSVRKSGDRVRVTAQLVDARDGAHAWSETYDRSVGDVLRLQDDIAAALVRALQITVGAAELSSHRSARNVGAYDVYLRGRYAMDRYDKSGFEEAAVNFRQALDLDPTFADAAAALSLVYEMQANWAFVPPATGFEQARRAASSALELDPALAVAYTVLGMIHVHYDWDWKAAEREFQSALKSNPHDPFVLSAAGDLQLALGHYANAARIYRDAIARDPLDAATYHMLSYAQVRLGDVAQAIASDRKALELQPSYVWASTYLTNWLLVAGDREAALAAAEGEDPVVRSGALAVAYWALGRKAEADAALRTTVATQADSNAYQVAWVYAYRGDRDEAFKWLERAYAQKDPCLYSIKGEPMLTNLEADARYKAFLHKMNLSE
jgi:adenylate cyclase